MNQNFDVDSFIKNIKDPSVLAKLQVKLYREMIARVIAGTDKICNDHNIRQSEIQLQEIAKAIANLEKKRVEIPEALRCEKARLAAQIEIEKDKVKELLNLAISIKPSVPISANNEMHKEIEALSTDLDLAIENLSLKLGLTCSNIQKSRKMRSRLPKTDKGVLRNHIVEALKNMGGRGKVADVIEEMGRQLESRLLAGDLECRESNGELAWKNNAKWERYRMVQEGILRSDSPRGIWELL